MSVYVARIPPECNERELKDIFEGVGPIKSATLKSSKGDHKTNYAFIDFVNDDDANCAVQYLNNYKVGDCKLQVNLRKKENSTSGSESSSSGVGGFKSASQRFPFKSTGIQGKGGFPTGFSAIRSTETFTENGGSTSQHSYPGTGMDENGWDDENESENNITEPNVSELKDNPSEEKVLVIHVEHPTKFWGQPVSQENAKTLDNIALELASECKLAKNVIHVLPRKVYGSKFSLDQQWYRCKIENNYFEQSNSKVKVRYIDYGNSEIVEADSLVELPISLQQKRPCAKEYKMDIYPVNGDENSDQFKQGLKHLQSLLNDQVVIVATSGGINSSVKVTVVSSNRNVADEMNVTGLTASIAMQKKNTSDIDTLSKPLQPLRSPRSATSSSSINGVSGQQISKEKEDLKMKMASLQNELQSSKLLMEKLKVENQILKQKNIDFEESLAKANSKINDISSWVVNAKFLKLKDDVSSLKNLRREMSFGINVNPVLKDVVASLTENKNSIASKSLSSFAQLLDAESELSSYQDRIRSCCDKDELPELVCKRDKSRKDFINETEIFLDDVSHLNFESREKELEVLLKVIEENYKIPENYRSCSNSISEAFESFENWKATKMKSLKETQEKVDVSSSLLTKNLEVLNQNLSINNERREFIQESQNIDDLISNYWKAVTDEITSIKETSIDTECRTMVSDIISSMVHSIHKERNDIVSLRDRAVEYKRKKSEFEIWITQTPDMLKLKETRTQLKALKSKFRHKQADRKDIEEDSEDDESLQKIEEEIRIIRNELHRLFIQESKLLGELSRIAESHFPEFNTLFPELGISACLESTGILHSRELDYYDHHFLPLISSATAQPLVFKSQFNQEDCVLKEYSLCSKVSREVFQSRVFKFAKCKHPTIISLDSLFYDKAGRKAYLQTPFYGDGNFTDFIETKPDSKDLLNVFYALLEAVETLHISGYVHGEIVPTNISIKKDENGVTLVLREPNFSSDEKKQLEDLANLYPTLTWERECLSKELDMLCLGLLMFSAYFPNQMFNANIMIDTMKDPIYDVMNALLHNSVTERLSATEAINHSAFKKQREKLNSLSEELIKTDNDPSDSFAIVELNVSIDCTEPYDVTQCDDSVEGAENEREDKDVCKVDQNELDTVDSTKLIAEE